MAITETTNETKIEAIEAVVGVFQDSEAASRAATEMRRQNVPLHRVSQRDASAEHEMPAIIYDEVEEVSGADVTGGILKGGAIGAGSGLLLIAVPGLNIAAPIFGAIAGAWIGGVASIDEAVRGIGLPALETYQQLLAEGRSFVVIAANESLRLEYAKQLENLGAIQVHQHPPALEASFHHREVPD